MLFSFDLFINNCWNK